MVAYSYQPSTQETEGGERLKSLGSSSDTLELEATWDTHDPISTISKRQYFFPNAYNLFFLHSSATLVELVGNGISLCQMP